MHIKRQIIYVLIIIILVNLVGNFFYKRFDLTQDKRYTLSNSAKETIANIDTPIFIDVFLEGDLPPEFKKLKVETKQLLQEFEAFNHKIKFKFVDPLNENGDIESLSDKSIFTFTLLKAVAQSDSHKYLTKAYPLPPE